VTGDIIPQRRRSCSLEASPPPKLDQTNLLGWVGNSFLQNDKISGERLDQTHEKIIVGQRIGPYDYDKMEEMIAASKPQNSKLVESFVFAKNDDII
jgi:hypothetical protein